MAKVTFWGVQGSSPGNKHPHQLGSNTTCVSIQHEKTLIILDAGTGLRWLSDALNSQNYTHIILLITHAHWDHIQGFPFFNFLHDPTKITIYSHQASHLSALLNQLNGVNFPLSIHDLPAHITTTTDLTYIQKDTDLCIKTMPTNHHGDCIGYRIKNAVFDLCFFPDNQLYGLSDHQRSALIAFCQDTHLLIHDSQYIDSDMPQKKDWGHSRVQEAHALAVQANARQYALFHHDPGRHKDTILQLTKTLNQPPRTLISIAAYDGLELVLLGNQPTL